jgi:hypothetical protein
VTNDPIHPQITIQITAEASQPAVARVIDVDVQAGVSGNHTKDDAQSIEVGKIGDTFFIEVFATPVPQSTFGGEITLDYDHSLFKISDLDIPNGFFILTSRDTLIAIGALGARALPSSGLFAGIAFEVIENLGQNPAEILIKSLHFDFEYANIDKATVRIVSGQKKTGDIDGNGQVGFSDFIIFAQGYGTTSGDSNFDSTLDFDPDGKIGFSDFLIFANAYGT